VKKKALLICPHFFEKGGVSYYNSIIKKNFQSDRIGLDSYHIGRNSRWKKSRLRIVKSLYDLKALNKKIPNYDLIIINPSLHIKSIIRDGVFHFLAKNIHKKRTIVFFHGWDLKIEKIINNYGKRLFKKMFTFDKGIVLSGNFRKCIIKWGYDADRVVVETTSFEQSQADIANNINNVIFLSRLASGKGTMIAIKAIENVSKEFQQIRLFVVGDGERLKACKQYVNKNSLQKYIKFTGWLQGSKKHSCIQKCGIMLFPTRLEEGMPISILEGMGAGLAIVTRPIGGIKDLLTDGINGFMLKTLNPDIFAEKIKWLLKNPIQWEKISEMNRRQALQKFEIKNVIKRMEQMYYETAN
jgi:glycosyltransferase involved in cell wall biosynthesis